MAFLEPTLAREMLLMKQQRSTGISNESPCSSSDDPNAVDYEQEVAPPPPPPPAPTDSGKGKGKGKGKRSKMSSAFVPPGSPTAGAANTSSSAVEAPAAASSSSIGAVASSSVEAAAAVATAASSSSAVTAAAASSSSVPVVAESSTAAPTTTTPSTDQHDEIPSQHGVVLLTQTDHDVRNCQTRIAVLSEDLRSKKYNAQEEQDKMDEIASETAQLKLHLQKQKIEAEKRREEERRFREDRSQQLFRLTQQNNKDYLDQEYNDWEREETVRRKLIQDVIDQSADEGNPISKPVLKLIDYFKGKLIFPCYLHPAKTVIFLLVKSHPAK